MKLGIVLERKDDFPFEPDDPKELDSELFSHFEEDELTSGLLDSGHEVIKIGDARRLLNRIGYWRKRCDIVFNLSVGYRGIERKLLAPSILEVAGIPYVGSTPYTLTLTRHKYHAKVLMMNAGLPTPPSVLLPSTSLLLWGSSASPL
jgi:D-alanine-D-alanine ligase